MAGIFFCVLFPTTDRGLSYFRLASSIVHDDGRTSFKLVR